MAVRRTRRKPRPADRIGSILILAGVAAVWLTVLLVGRTGDRPLDPGRDPRWGADLVAPGQIGDLELAATRVFDAEDLYEYINGQAPHYIQFGFRALLVAEYAAGPAELPSVMIDLYDMQRRRNAYGLFMESFPPEAELIDLGNGGFLSGSVAVFWKGSFYVRVMGLGASASESAVETAAGLIAERIEDDSRELAEFAVFSREGLAEDTLSFLKAAPFGLAHLREAFVAGYDTPEGAFRLFFCELEGPEAVVEAVRAHAGFLEGRGGLQEANLEGENLSVWGEDRYIGASLLMGRGRFLAGSLRITDVAEARRQVEDLLNRAESALDSGGKDGGIGGE